MEMPARVVRLVKWPYESIPPDVGELQEQLERKGWRPLRMEDPPSAYYPERQQQHEEVCWLVRGRLEVGFPDGEVFRLLSGDRVELPAGSRHWLRVLSGEGALYLLGSR